MDKNGRKATIIANFLKDGYGSEDIEVLAGIPVDQTRAHIARWRKHGLLTEVLRKGLRACLNH